MDWSALLTGWLAEYGYVAVVVVLILCGVGLPIPEELTFILAGFTVHKCGLNLEIMIACAMVGLILGDTILFCLGKYCGQALLTRWPFKKFFTAQRIKDAEDFFHKWGSWTIFAAGFVAGVRACTYFLAASMGVKYRRFIFLDFARAILTCPVSIYLGWRFGHEAEHIMHRYTLPLMILIVLVACYFVIRWYTRKQTPPTEPPDTGSSAKEAASAPTTPVLPAQSPKSE